MITGLRDGLHWGAGGWVNGERSPDLPRVIGAMHQLAAISCPDLPVKQARQRWPRTSTARPTWTC